MEQTQAAPRGVWGNIARRERPGELARALVNELDNGLALLAKLPPAVTFFGGARIRRDDPYYEAGVLMGELLAARGIPPRTGAGPGIMSAVPEGFRRALAAQGNEAAADAIDLEQIEEDDRFQALTQGFNIRLPFEQAVNPAIDVALELMHFPTRKLMLYENVLGLVIFPGGFGTLDELFEVWRLRHARRLHDPFVLFGTEFWGPLIDRIRSMSVGAHRLATPPETFKLLHLTDDPEEAMSLATGGHSGSAFGEPPEVLGRRIAEELVEGLEYLAQRRPAVTVLAGSALAEGDPAIADCEEMARLLAEQGVPTRAGGPGVVSIALARGGHRGAPYLPQQAFGMRREDHRNLYGADRLHVVNDRLTHKVLLTEGATAIVAFPGGLGALDELFSVICQLQTRKIPSRRVVLYDSSFWRPLWDDLRRLMLDGERRTISPGDLELVCFADDPAEVARLCLEPPPELPPREGRRPG